MIAYLYHLEDEELEEENISSAASYNCNGYNGYNSMLYNNFYYNYNCANTIDSIRERQNQLMYSGASMAQTQYLLNNLSYSMHNTLGGNYTPVYTTYGQWLCDLKK